MEQPAQINETILWGYFAETLTPAERKDVEYWLRQSETHKSLARDIHYIYSATDTLQTIRQLQLNSPAALENVKRQIRKHRRMHIFRWIQRTAAILFVPLLVSIIYNEVKEEPTEYISIHTNPGMMTNIDLPDGSKVWLNSGSVLRRPVKFTGNTREVQLSGEAYFQIAGDAKRKFIVAAGNHLKVEVLGTEFNIEAYQEDGFIATTLIRGSISLSYISSNNQRKSLIMQPNQKVFYYENTQSIKSRPTYVAADIAWIEGKISFRNTPLEIVLKKLSHRFNVDFIIQNEEIKQYPFTGTFDKQQLVQILEHFRISSNIQYRITEPSLSGNIQKRGEVILY
ncbi:MAG: DUF4974 domain-containing protein [Tannerellaceae bacterium]|jgi:ferric-dicitrate binding protein FerR (iron transport regulator)|nr:DUF4974 domain-containing protein [Tannerellaceae bacterium]